MPVQINITNNDIYYAEKILLSEGQQFDQERRIFIKNLSTIDLQAVPGSGKTTALLAKLLILEKYLPFDNGSGILVISHTNAAIDEIKNKIEKFCPKLFTYPNFVGTIQSFVDQFLAIPCYSKIFKKKPLIIDNEIHDGKIDNYYMNMPNSAAKIWIDKKHDPISFLKSIRFDTELNLIEGVNGKVSLKSENNSQTYRNLAKLKYNIFSQGYLHFDDAYFFANRYFEKIPPVKNLIQKRFRYVFVDEMQDMDKHQYDLLEEAFYNNGKSHSIYQRIGDKNQAIFNGSAKLDDIWQNREVVLKLKGSYRLTPAVANIVKYFGMEFIDIEGRYVNESNIQPRMIVFDNHSQKNVIHEFINIIKQLQTEGRISTRPKHPFKAIAWRKDKFDNGKIGLKNYWNDFTNNNHKAKHDYSCIENYLIFYNKDYKSLKSINTNITNVFLRILRYENILDNDRNYTKIKMFSFLRENNEEQYEKLKLFLYQWSIRIIKGEITSVLSDIKSYLPQYLSFFGGTVNKSKNFINDKQSDEAKGIVPLEPVKSKGKNIFKSSNINIEIGTVHSTKGQTHTATLYMETFYSRGKGNYESERLLEQFKGNMFKGEEIKVVKQSAKMVYVGFSRPTHLLCFAVHKNRFKQFSNSVHDNWKIIEMN